MIASLGSVVFDEILIVDSFSKNSSSRILDMKKFFGGAASNVSLAISRLGGKSRLISVAGQDFNHEYKKYLEREGVDLNVFVKEGELTFRTYIISVPGKEQQEIYFYDNKRLVEFYRKNFDKFNFKNIKIAHFTTWSDLNLYEKVMKKIKGEILISFDPGQETKNNVEKVTELLKYVDFLFVNEYEAQTIENYLNKDIFDLNIKLICVSLGKEGAKFKYKGKEFYIKSVKPKKEVDPTGCGDSHRAGFLYSYLKGYDIETCGKIAATVASFVIEKEGAQTNLPDWDKVKKRYEEFWKETIA